MQLALIEGQIVSTITKVTDPEDVQAKGTFARFVVEFDCGESHSGTCKMAVYRRLTPAVPNPPVVPLDRIIFAGPLFSTAWGGTAVEAETMSLADVKESAGVC